MGILAIIRKAKRLKRVRRKRNINVREWELFVDSFKKRKVKRDLENKLMELMDGQLLTNITLNNIYNVLNFIRWCVVFALFAFLLFLFHKL